MNRREDRTTTAAGVRGRMAAAFRLAVAAAVGGLAGCATRVPPEPIASAGQSAQQFEARSLGDPELHRFIAENLGRDPGEHWDFESLCWAAFRLNPSLATARAQWAAARVAIRTAALPPNPTLTLTPGYNFTRQPGLSPWMPAISLDFLFETAGKRRLRADAARHDADAARFGFVDAAWQVRSALRQALVEAADASRRAAQLAAETAERRRFVELIEQRFAAGAIAAPEVSTARTALLQAEAAADDARGRLLAGRARVAAAIGVPLAALGDVRLPEPPAPALDPAALATARSAALRSRADILLELARYRSAQAALQLEVARRFPDLHLGPGYQWDQGSNKWSLGVGFELPLFHGHAAAIAEAVARRGEAAARFEQVQAQAIAAIDLATAGIEAAQRRREHARRAREEAERQLARATQRVAAGAADRLELQTARLAAAAARTVVLEADNAAALAAGRLEDALQMPFPTLIRLTASENPTSHPSP